MGIKIWLDDIRSMPEGFDVWCKNSNDAMLKIVSGNVSQISIDHDLGEFSGTGYDVAKAIEYWAYYNVIKRLNWDIHSANPIGRKNIEMAMKNADKYWARNEEI